jgi:hypothetical protein
MYKMRRLTIVVLAASLFASMTLNTLMMTTEYHRGYARGGSRVYGIVEVIDDYVYEDELPWGFIDWMFRIEAKLLRVG